VDGALSVLLAEPFLIVSPGPALRARRRAEGFKALLMSRTPTTFR